MAQLNRRTVLGGGLGAVALARPIAADAAPAAKGMPAMDQMKGGSAMLKLVPVLEGFDIIAGETTIVRHRGEAPAFFVGRGEARVAAHHGNFRIEDRLSARLPLTEARIAGRTVTLAERGGAPLLTITIEHGALAFTAHDPTLDRFWLRLVAEADEHLWGAGEQYSYLDLKGRRYPLWTSEPGVGRDKTSLLTFKVDQAGHGGGGDYWNTGYPQPTFLSSRRYALHVDSSAYAVFDFREAAYHEIELWEVPARIELWSAPTLIDLVGQISTRFGRQPRLPAWAISGAIVGLKDGANSFARLDRIVAAGAVVSGLWCEDWVGLRQTSFGSRLFWDWTANEARYPGLRQRIAELADRGIRFLGYVNPYLATDGALYREAADLGYFVRRADTGAIYVADFGEFTCGTVDLTNPDAMDWFAERVIGRNMLDFGLAGWMADFGEYLPVDVKLASGMSGMLAHNLWPALWAETNAKAVASRGLAGEALFFMRSGFTGSQAHCPLLWAGDQCVDFSRHDGIGTVIRAALSSGLIGNAYHHSDLGGYTSLFGNVRTPELLMRWSELAAFAPVMRSHEGNRPGENVQLDSDPKVLAHFAAMTRVHAALAPYVAILCDEAATTGLPLQRPLFLHFEEDAATFEIETQFLYGPDLLVAPVIEADARTWPVYLPAGVEWVHLWSGERHRGGGHVTIAAPLGQPPVFHRAGSAHAAVFRAAARA